MTKTKTMCRPHDQQFRRTGEVSEIPWNGGKGKPGTCTFPDCGRQSRSGTEPLCEGHYYQRRRGAELRPLRPYTYGPVCDVDGCETAVARGRYCPMHAARIRRQGDPQVAIHQRDRDLPRGENHPMWNPEGSYVAIHLRIKREHGPARNYPCTFGCGSQAEQWAYVGPRTAGQRLPWGNTESYSPLCVPCHKKFDLSWMTHDDED